MFARNERREERERATGNWIFDEIPILRIRCLPFHPWPFAFRLCRPSTFISSLFLVSLFSFSSSSERKESRTLVWTKLESQSRVSCYGFKVKSVAGPSSPFVIYADKPVAIERLPLQKLHGFSKRDDFCETTLYARQSTILLHHRDKFTRNVTGIKTILRSIECCYTRLYKWFPFENEATRVPR